MNSDAPAVQPISPTPGFLKSLLIHLAGGDPKVFPYLPSHEASDFAKLGASVLVPVMLALTAGTFTLWHMAPGLGWGVALGGGLMWGIVILIIDVAVMSQIIKSCKVPPAPAPTGPVRAFAPKPAESAESTVNLPWVRNKIIGGMRVMIAIVLGLFMSHSLVLTLFNKKIDQRLRLQRVEDRSKLKEVSDRVLAVQTQLSAAERAALARDDTTFRKLYDEYQRSRIAESTSEPTTGSSAQDTTTPTAAPTAGDTPTSSDLYLATLQSDLAAELERQKNELSELTLNLKFSREELNALRSDLREAKAMLRAEKEGREASFNFSTPEFTRALGTTTSGKPGDGSRGRAIDAQIKTAGQKEKLKEEELKKLEEHLAALNAEHAGHRQELEKKISERRGQLQEDLRTTALAEDQRRREEAEKERADTQRLRDKLGNEVTRLQADLDRAQEKEREALRPFEGGSDFLEQTAALMELLFNENQVSETGQPESAYKQSVLIGTVTIVLLSFILIDLAPLMMKLLRAPSAYDVYLAMMRNHRFAFPIPGVYAAPVQPENGPQAQRRRLPQPAYVPHSHSEPPPPPPDQRDRLRRF